MQKNDIAVSVQHASKSFEKGIEVLHDVHHDFREGLIHGVIGNNGSGKTVLFKCICGFMPVTKGKIFVDYQQVGKDMDFPDNMGIIIETPGFLPYQTGMRNLSILASLKKKINEKTIYETIQRVGLDPDSKKHVCKYSLGMRQRLGIAQAIMEDPLILILDEPFNGLDKHAAADMRGLLKGLKEKGKTILLASHNQADIDELCDTVCEMDAGILTVVR